MLRKRTRSHHKDENQKHLMSDADILGSKHKNDSYFKVPGLFVEFQSKNSDSDSLRSPTSPLDFRIFSGFGNPFRLSRSSNEVERKSWDCSKVGLSIIDSLVDESNQSGKVIQSSDNKSIVLGRQISVKSMNFCSQFDSVAIFKSLPKNVDVFPISGTEAVNMHTTSSNVLSESGEISLGPFEDFRSCSLDSARPRLSLSKFNNVKSNLGSGCLVAENATSRIGSKFDIHEGSLNLGDCSLGNVSPSNTFHSGSSLIGSISAHEIEHSEDYTCVRTHGPNPKVTHIFSDCILDCHGEKLSDCFRKSEDVEDDVTFSEIARKSNFLAYPAVDFMKSCYSCKKNLDGEDIFMYRGKKTFCSWICRSQEILIDEEMEITSNNHQESPKSQTTA